MSRKLVVPTFVAIAGLLMAGFVVPPFATGHGFFLSEDQSSHNSNYNIHSRGKSYERWIGQEFKIDGWTPESSAKFYELERIVFYVTVPDYSGNICEILKDDQGNTIKEACRNVAVFTINLNTHQQGPHSFMWAILFGQQGESLPVIEAGRKYTLWVTYDRDCQGGADSCSAKVYFQNQDFYRGTGFAKVRKEGGDTFTDVGHDMAFRVLPNSHSPIIVTDGADGESFQDDGLHLNFHAHTGDNGGTLKFNYGTTTAYGSTSSTVSCPGDGSDCVRNIGGLRQATTYHYQAVASNVAGEQNGNDRTKTTSDPAPGKPTLAGPDFGKSNVALTFTSTARDGGDDVRIGFDWDNNNAVEAGDWSGFVANVNNNQRSRTWTADGDFDIKVIAEDNTGNTASPWSDVKHIVIDSVAPSNPNIQSVSHPNQGAWSTNNDPQFTWTEQDDRSGIAGTRHRLDNGNFGALSPHQSAGYTDLADGQHTFEVQVEDRSGNQASGTYNFKIDTVAPTKARPLVTTGTLGENGWHKTSVTLEIDSADATSGVNCEYHATTSSGTWQPANCVAQHSWTVSQDGQYTFWGRAVDNAGLERAGQDSIALKVDASNPTITDNQPNVSWTTQLPCLDIDFGDATSGLWSVEYRMWTGAGQTGGLLKDWTPIFSTTTDGTGSYTQCWFVEESALQQGENFVSVRAKDRAGSLQTVVDAVKIQWDTVAPTSATPTATCGNQGENGWRTSNVCMEINSADATSGVASEWHSDVGPQGPWSGGASQDTWTISTEGTKTWFGRAVDAADNAFFSSGQAVKLDKTTPRSQVELTGISGDNGWFTTDVSATIICADDVSGVQHIRSRLNAGAWATTLANSKVVNVNGEGQHTVDFSCKDMAGNSDGSDAAPKSQAVKIDKQAPEASHSTSCTIGDNQWCVSSVSVTISATDAMSGVDRICRQIDQAGWACSPSNPLQFTITTIGSHKVEYYVVDKAGWSTGSQLSPRSFTFKLDDKAPTSSASFAGTSGTDGWFISPVTVTLGASDQVGASNVRETRYGLDTPDTPTVYTGSFVVSSELDHGLRVSSTDQAGNREAAVPLRLKIDLAPPQLSDFTQVPADLDAGHIGNVQVNIGIDGGPSGIVVAEFRASADSGLSWGGWTPATHLGDTQYRFDILEPNPGWWAQKTLQLQYQVRAVDGAGNADQTDIKCDGAVRRGCDVIQRVAPSVSMVAPTVNADWGNGVRTIEWRGQDRDHDTVTYRAVLVRSGDPGFVLQLGTKIAPENGALNLYSLGFDTKSVADGSDYVMKLQANDGLLQAPEARAAFLIDNTPPKVEFTRPTEGQFCTLETCVDDPLGDTRVAGRVTLEAAAEDLGAAPSGVNTVEFQIDGGAWLPAAFNANTGKWTRLWDTTLVPIGDHVLKVRATDDAGNTPVPRGLDVKVIV